MPLPPLTLLEEDDDEEEGEEENPFRSLLSFRFPRPFEGNYALMLGIAILALVPFIIISTAYALYRKDVGGDLHISPVGLEIIAGEATGGYAFGALVAGDLVQRFPQRILFLLCEALFIVACVISGAAGGEVAYGAGRILAGFATGLLLVVALPPVIQKFPAAKLKITVVGIDMAFFGAVCVGPLLGGPVAVGHVWRWFYAGMALLGFIGFALALVTLPDQDPPNPDLRFDASAIMLGLGATVLPFWGAGELTLHHFTGFRFTVPISVGLACLVALFIVEYARQEPLAPVKPMWNTLPVVGTLTAMTGGALFVTFLELAEQFQMQVAHHPPNVTGLMFWPQVVGVLITSVLLGVLIGTRFLPVLILLSMMAMLGGGGMLLTLGPDGSPAMAMAAAGLLGLGAGGTVSPGLYLAGFSLPSKMIGRVFALIELVRSVADYILAPVIIRIARDVSGHKLTAHGIEQAIWVTVLIGVGMLVLGVVLYVIGGPGLPKPDLEKWLGENKTAVPVFPLAARLRPSGREGAG